MSNNNMNYIMPYPNGQLQFITSPQEVQLSPDVAEKLAQKAVESEIELGKYHAQRAIAAEFEEVRLQRYEEYHDRQNLKSVRVVKDSDGEVYVQIRSGENKILARPLFENVQGLCSAILFASSMKEEILYVQWHSHTQHSFFVNLIEKAPDRELEKKFQLNGAVISVGRSYRKDAMMQLLFLLTVDASKAELPAHSGWSDTGKGKFEFIPTYKLTMRQVLDEMR